jgi:hypothetical protein
MLSVVIKTENSVKHNFNIILITLWGLATRFDNNTLQIEGLGLIPTTHGIQHAT